MKTHDDWDGIERVPFLLKNVFGASLNRATKRLSYQMMGKLYYASVGMGEPTPVIILRSNTTGNVSRALEMLSLRGMNRITALECRTFAKRAFVTEIINFGSWSTAEVVRGFSDTQCRFRTLLQMTQVFGNSSQLPCENLEKFNCRVVECGDINLPYLMRNRLQLWQEIAAKCQR